MLLVTSCQPVLLGWDVDANDLYEPNTEQPKDAVMLYDKNITMCIMPILIMLDDSITKFRKQYFSRIVSVAAYGVRHLVNIGSVNGSVHIRREAITWTNLCEGR